MTADKLIQLRKLLRKYTFISRQYRRRISFLSDFFPLHRACTVVTVLQKPVGVLLVIKAYTRLYGRLGLLSSTFSSMGSLYGDTLNRSLSRRRRRSRACTTDAAAASIAATDAASSAWYTRLLSRRSGGQPRWLTVWNARRTVAQLAMSARAGDSRRSPSLRPATVTIWEYIAGVRRPTVEHTSCPDDPVALHT